MLSHTQMHSPQPLRALAQAPTADLDPPLTSRATVQLDRLATAAAALIVLAYVVYFATLWPPPLQDFPNHLARASVIADALFDGGARFGSSFGVQLLPIPYLLHDLVFATLIHVFGNTAGSA